MKKTSLLRKFLYWRIRNISNKQFLLLLSIIIGIVAGFVAFVMKNLVHQIKDILQHGFSEDYHNYLYFAYPMIGIFITIIFIKYINKHPVRHGIPNVLHSISKKNGKMNKHNMFSSIIASGFTVGFGGSVGLEGPTVATVAAYSSNLSQFFNLNYKQIKLMLGCACAGAMAAIFKAPLAALVFAFEVIMIDLTTFSLVPILLTSTAAYITSLLIMGDAGILNKVQLSTSFVMHEIPFYIFLGVFTGLLSVYFTRTYMYFQKLFNKLSKNRYKILIGGIVLGVLIFLFPSLYGEGYDAINSCLEGDVSYLFNKSVFYDYKGYVASVLILMFVVVLLKTVAASLTFRAGGVGGIFAPTLFMGANSGFLFALFVNNLGFDKLNETHFALVGMSGLISGVLHAPLTGIFLIGDITGGYQLFLPLMITATFSYITVTYFESNSVYTIQLARRKELITHHMDKAVLSLMNVTEVMETDFKAMHPEATLGELVKVISVAHRNVFPIIDENKILKGILKMDDIRHIMFEKDLYNKIKMKDIMYPPEFFVSPEDSMEVIAMKIQTSGRFNLPVVTNDGKYLGFVSRANVFSSYRKMLQEFSND